MGKRSVVLFAIFALMVATIVGVDSYAAPGAGAKASGQFNFYGGASRNALSSARAQTGTFRQYAESVTAGDQGMHASPIVAKEASDTIAQAVAKSESYLGAVRKRVAGDEVAAAALDAIAMHLAEVKKCCAELAECCEADLPDAKRSADCCKALENALAKAIAAHDKLVAPPPVDHHAAPKAGGHHMPTP